MNIIDQAIENEIEQEQLKETEEKIHCYFCPEEAGEETLRIIESPKDSGFLVPVCDGCYYHAQENYGDY